MQGHMNYVHMKMFMLSNGRQFYVCTDGTAAEL